MKRLLTLLVAAFGLTLLFAIGISAEERTATFYNGNTKLEEKSFSGDSLTLPNQVGVGAKRFVGWTLVNGNEKTLYVAGSTISVPEAGDLRFEVCSIDLRTMTGAAVSTTGDAVLRFDGVLNSEDLNALTALVGADNISIGILIAPYKSVGSTPITLDASIDGLLNRTSTGFLYTTARYRVFGGKTESIPDNDILEKYTARAYMSINVGGETVTVYAAYNAVDHSRSVHGVSAAAFEDRASIKGGAYTQKTDAGCYSRYTSAQLSLLRDRLDKVVCVGSITSTEVEQKYSLDNFTFISYHPDHYTSPYRVKEILQQDNGYETILTYVIVATGNADHNDVCAYFLEGSYRAPNRALEWREDGIYISTSTSTGH